MIVSKFRINTNERRIGCNTRISLWFPIASFIRRIEVYEKFEKYSRTAGNPIRIHYAFRLPEQEGAPAIDVLAQPTAKTA